MCRFVTRVILSLFMVFSTACSFKNDGSLLVLEGDGDRTCSELQIEWEKADQLSRENVEARKRWILQLLRKKDCRLPNQPNSKFQFHLSISG